jgi:sialate O-acetylesterase
MKLGWTLGIVLVIFACPKARAEVTPNALISDGMVLQQGMKVPIWGSAGDDERVTVQFQGQTVSTTAAGGHWQVKLNDLKAGGPFEMTIAGKNTLHLRNILVGEVWIASGQSNMEMALRSCAHAQTDIAASHDPMLRLFTVPHVTALEPRHELKGSWKESGPTTAASFSAVAYYFGRDLRKALNVPVGIIHSSWGGTLAEAWTAEAALERHPDFKNVKAQIQTAIAKYEAAKTGQDKNGQAGKGNTQKARAGARAPVNPAHNPNTPTALYNGMIAPLIPFAIKGAIWYQGESNASRAHQYQTLFPAMIQNWRHDWGQGDFPFLFVQLAPWQNIVKEPQESQWAELREAQLFTSLHLPHTGMAVITDVGEEKDIHPKQKEPVGARLALAALAIAYGQNIAYSGPIYDHMKVEGNKALLYFKHTGRGLEARGGEMTGFTLAGADKKFVNAQARIQGEHVIVESPEVAKPAAVRFGWANFPVVNLWNKDGLPASPFRTDGAALSLPPGLFQGKQGPSKVRQE